MAAMITPSSSMASVIVTSNLCLPPRASASSASTRQARLTVGSIKHSSVGKEQSARHLHRPTSSPLRQASSTRLQGRRIIAQATEEGNGSQPSGGETEEVRPPFGSTRLDVILIGVGLTVGTFVLKGLLELAGLDDIQSGQVVTFLVIFGGSVAWALIYTGRVVSKDMTYVKQLEQYEEAVMQKRLDEIPEAELELLLEEIEKEKADLQARRERRAEKLKEQGQ